MPSKQSSRISHAVAIVAPEDYSASPFSPIAPLYWDGQQAETVEEQSQPRTVEERRFSAAKSGQNEPGL